MLIVEDLVVRYGGVEAVRGVSLGCENAQVTAVLGANGAGKSSLLNAIAGVIKPVRGRILIRGQQIEHLGAHRVVALGVALVPEGRHVFPEFTVGENLQLTSRSVRRGRGDISAALDLFPVLRQRLRQPAGSLSGGEQQMVAIARAMVAEPDVLLLDEPSMGLAPHLVHRVFEALAQIRDQGTAIVVAEQNVREALNLADAAYVLRSGSVVAAGSSRALATRGDLAELYLGQGAGSPAPRAESET